MTTTPSRLGLPAFTVADAHLLWKRIDEAQAGLESAIAEVRTVLQQRDLLALWDDEAGSFIPEFLPLATRYHELQRALLELTGERSGRSHDLSTWVEAQR